MELSVEGRVVAITGGSQGLGLATALAFAQAGADVVILARRASQLQEAQVKIESIAKGKVMSVVCDVSSAADIERAHADIDKVFGRIDVLINNAGKSQVSRFEGISDDIWQSDLDLKLFAAIRMTRLVWPGMQERRWGRVINVLNTYAKAPAAGTAPTSVTRAAGMALTKVLAAEGGPHNILVNAMLVGLIDSEQTHKWHGQMAPDKSYDEFTAEFSKDIPLRRLGRAEEFASTALFLAGAGAGYLTGTAINVDGGSCPVV